MTAKDRARELADEIIAAMPDNTDYDFMRVILERALTAERSAGRAEAFEESAKVIESEIKMPSMRKRVAAAIRKLAEAETK